LIFSILQLNVEVDRTSCHLALLKRFGGDFERRVHHRLGLLAPFTGEPRRDSDERYPHENKSLYIAIGWHDGFTSGCSFQFLEPEEYLYTFALPHARVFGLICADIRNPTFPRFSLETK
jgi:hypothetical protein